LLIRNHYIPTFFVYRTCRRESTSEMCARIAEISSKSSRRVNIIRIT